jgi:nitric oxide reductase NorE protein
MLPSEQSPTGRSSRLPGDSGIWTFIIADMAAFAMFFLIFSVGRMAAPELYEESRQHLDTMLGLLNTLILLTSSLFMVRAVEAARVGQRSAVVRNLLLTIFIGMGFAVTKVIEYSAKADAGIGLTSNEFFTYYFAFTGIHFLHFAIGIGALALMVMKARADVIDTKFVTWIESVGCYWHMVDLLWIMLFPMLYLLRAA